MKIGYITTILMTLLLVGCAQPSVREVKIPVKCDVPLRERPPQVSSFEQYFIMLLLYVEGLERDLAFCRGEHTEINIGVSR